MIYQQMLNYFAAKGPEMISVIQELVTQESPSDDKPRLDAFAEYLANRLRAAGAETEIIPSIERGNHLRARFGFERFSGDNQDAPPSGENGLMPGPKPALILCHYDTVWPVGSLETHPFRIEDGRAYGPGIFDMQTSLMLVEYALHAIQDLSLELPRPVTILMTSDEEVGSHTSRALIEEEGQLSEYVLVLESPLPGGVLKTARKGGGNFEVEITGRAAHAGVEPEKGISAIFELAQQILAIHALGDADAGTTVNVDVVHGGTKANVIPAHAVGYVDVRAWSQEEIMRVTQAIRTLQPVTPGARIDVSGGANRPPLEKSATRELFQRVQVVGKRLGLDLEEGSTGGGSDGSWTGALGIPTLDGMGVPGHGAHADHEHIEVEHISSSVALLTACLHDL